MKPNLTRAQACKLIAATTTLGELHSLTTRIFGAPVERLAERLADRLAGIPASVNKHVQRAYAEKETRLKASEARALREADDKARRSAAARKGAETRKVRKLAQASV